MPQEIPVEASETLVYTPECFANIDGAPSFVLRAATTREKRFQRRLFNEEGVRTHTVEAIRAEVMNSLKEGWTEEQFEEWSPIIKDYWTAGDDFELQAKDDKDLVFSYDPAIEKAVKELVDHVAESSRTLRKMLADNNNYSEMLMVITAALLIKSWKGLPTVRKMDRGYLTVECAEDLREELWNFEKANEAEHKLVAGTAWLQLFSACFGRMYLSETEAGNSELPSPSETSPAASNLPSISEEGGKSPASARSKKTPVSA